MAGILGNVINVKDAPYNAAGNGVTDDRAAIQAAIVACFGSLPAGNANTSYNNLGTLWFPPGNYAIGDNAGVSGLIFPSMSGGTIRGAGSRATKFTYTGTFPNGGYDGTNTLFSLTGAQGCEFQGFTLDFQDPTNVHDTICFDDALHVSNVVGDCSHGNTQSPNARGGVIQTTSNTFRDIATKNALHGICMGLGDCAGVDNQVLFQCELSDHNGSFGSGSLATNLNAISNMVFKCRFVRCGQDEVAAGTGGNPLRGAISSRVGNFHTCIATDFVDSTCDDVNQGNSPISILGCKSTNSGVATGGFYEKYPWFIANDSFVYIAGLIFSTPNAVDNRIIRNIAGTTLIMDGCNCLDSDGRIDVPSPRPPPDFGFFYIRPDPALTPTFGAADALTAFNPQIWEPPFTVLADTSPTPPTPMQSFMIEGVTYQPFRKT